MRVSPQVIPWFVGYRGLYLQACDCQDSAVLDACAKHPCKLANAVQHRLKDMTQFPVVALLLIVPCLCVSSYKRTYRLQ
jgi:hypothetical protein